MSSVKRRPGRPNRGGGKFAQKSKGGGGGGGGGGSKKGGAAQYDGDEAYVDVRPVETPGVEEGHSEKYKVEMQKLHMTEQNQELIKAALLEIRGGDLELRAAGSYREQGRRLEHAYWLKDNHLLVRGGVDYSLPQNSETEDSAKEQHSFGLQKLLGIGFHRSRCLESLKECDGDVGAALELIMADSFNLKKRKSCSPESETDQGPGEIVRSDFVENSTRNVDDQDLRDQRNDEKMALESIYENVFTEKLQDKVWEFRLPLDHLWKYLPQEKKTREREGKKKKDDKNLCKFFQAGHCRFGSRCYHRHVNPEQTGKAADEAHLTGAKDEKIFVVEVRFPDGCRYPLEPCIVTFSTPLSMFPRTSCMKITARLMEESISCARDGLPSVFSIMSVLDNPGELDQVIQASESKLSLPRPVGGGGTDYTEEEEEGVNGGEALLGALEKPARREEKQRLRYGQMINLNRRMKSNYMKKIVSGEKGKFDAVRQSLPAWKEQEKILSLLARNQVLVISGMTGCGKSTQVPQFILDDWLADTKRDHVNIVCTQPRRISAVGVAGRVAEEREEKVGGVVGYQIRLETCVSDRTRLSFCTTGILLRRLESDPTLTDVTHVIVDEVHERSEESDFLLMILRDTLKDRPDLKVILMSATVNADLFSNYFKGAPVLDIPGRTFPVEQTFLEDILEIVPYSLEENSPYARRQEKNQGGFGGLNKEIFSGDCRDAYLDSVDADLILSGEGVKAARDKTWDEKCDVKQVYQRYENYSPRTARTLSLMDWDKINFDLIESVLTFVADGGSADMRLPTTGSILVFLPGLQEIMTLYDQMSSHPRLGKKAGKFLLIPLHSSLSSEEQQLVFSKPKKGQRKIVISTNLAETSITIDDCVFVIDVGRMKEKRFDPNKNMESLDTVWVSQANALQRKGRAGRVMEGFCFHLYTWFRYNHHMRKDPVPEIQRVPLEKMILRIKILSAFQKKTVRGVLSKILEPPSVESIQSSLTRLGNVGALYPDDSLTPLGYHLAQLPVDVRIGKLMLYGCMFRCLDASLTIAACLSFKSPFLSPFKEREAANKARSKFVAGNSDQLTAWRAFQAWTEAASRGQQVGWVFSQENFLSQKSLQTISQMKHQFVELLSSIGFLSEPVTSRDLDRAARGKGGADAVATVTGPGVNANNDNTRVVTSVLCAALYPNIVKILSPEAKYKQTATGAMARPPRPEDLKFKTSEDGYVNLHPSSVTATVGYFDTPYLVYHEKIKTSRVFVRELSMVPMYPMILFGGTGVEVMMQRGQFVVSLEKGWIKFLCQSHLIAELLKEMRTELDNLLEEKIANPQLDLIKDKRGAIIIKTITRLISTE